MTQKLLIALSIYALISIALAQSGGNGISKSTWASSDPKTCLAWFLKYIPQAVVSQDSCSDCECATQGRAQIKLKASAGGNPQDTFGMHTINCTHHPYGSQSLKQIETLIQNELGDFTKYNIFMEYNTGLWINDLDSIIKSLDSNAQKYLPIKFQYQNKTYYSILVNTCGYVNVEFISNSQTTLSEDAFTLMEDRMIFEDFNTILEGNFITPLKVSRATNSIDKVKEYYTEILSAQVLYENVQKNGNSILIIQMPGAKVHIHFVQPAAEKINDEGYTVKEFEDYTNSVHNEVIKSYDCGFDQWADNHFAIDNQSMKLTDLTKKMDAKGYKYRWFGSSSWFFGLKNVYAIDPTGFSIQLDGDSSGCPWFLPYYSAACKSNDGCEGQGHCKAYYTKYVHPFLESME